MLILNQRRAVRFASRVRVRVMQIRCTQRDGITHDGAATKRRGTIRKHTDTSVRIDGA